MLTEQKLLFSWWPYEETQRVLLNLKTDILVKSVEKHTYLVCGCLAPSCRAGQCSCPGWSGRQDSACCCWIPLAWKPAASAAPAAAASTLQKKRWIKSDDTTMALSELGEKSKIIASPFRVREINVGPEFDDLFDCFLLWAAGKRRSLSWRMPTK